MCVLENNKENLITRLRDSFLGSVEERDHAVRILADRGSQVCFEQGRYVFRSASACNVFMVLLAGTIRVQLSSSRGREVTLYRVTPGDACCVTTSCMFSGDAYPVEAIAESRVEAIAIDREVFHLILDRSPAFRQYVFDGYATNLASIIAKFEQTSFSSIDTRLSGALLELDDKGESRVTHQELAGELGTAREVISRRLKQFESEGWIRLSRGRIIVSDRVGLQSLEAMSSFD